MDKCKYEIMAFSGFELCPQSLVLNKLGLLRSEDFMTLAGLMTELYHISTWPLKGPWHIREMSLLS